MSALQGNQAQAVDPRESVWLSASAGTGKTHVLTSRVLRLLLQPGVEPSQILCLTFTKAGAAEMAQRINERLAGWVRLGDVPLAAELRDIGSDYGPEALARARTLFAGVLDCPGGGLRIDTIHAFCQWLLGAFPFEAGLIPGARAMEDRERLLLARQVLGDLLVGAEAGSGGDPALLEAVSALSLRMGPEAVEDWLLRCGAASALWRTPGWQAGEPLRPAVLRLLELSGDADGAMVAALCRDAAFDVAALRLCLSAYGQWNGKKGTAGRAAIAEWLASDPAGRAERLDALFAVLFTQKNTVKDVPSLEKFEPGFGDAAERVLACALEVRAFRILLDLAERLVPALGLGRAFALAWDAAKQREGLIDFDDQIRLAAGLLKRSELADWIRYKLDRRFDHILVDEAQDTNKAQWDIVFALAEEFWAGLGQRGEALRTLFVVGDYKQAIFRFQGTSPENFRRAGARVRRLIDSAAENAGDAGAPMPARSLLDLGLDRSFRTAQPVLDFVNAAIAGIGHAAFGLDEPAKPHTGDDQRPGYVALWNTVGGKGEAGGESDANDEPADEGDAGSEGWLSRSDRQMAERIALQVREWLHGPDGFVLVKGELRRARAGDVMVLVRKRRELAGLIVARLHAAGIPVAGVDRLRIGAPLAVRDLVAALRFAAQPLDCLNLAALLVSPLIGWSQEQLLEHGYRGKDVRLWDHLRGLAHPDVAAFRDRVEPLLAMADNRPVAEVLHWLLVGPWQGRRRLVARLGHEANDPIDELLNAAHAGAKAGANSLAGFLHWFDAGEGELKREAESGGDLVRVMTVHGSKGLQAPIVILADAAGKPGGGNRAGLGLPSGGGDGLVPLPGLRKEEQVGPVQREYERSLAEELQEHWRLLYVAMTRAEEALFIGGALGSQEKAPHDDSWYARLAPLFGADAVIADPLWGGLCEWGSKWTGQVLAIAAAPPASEASLPPWLASAAPDEPRPARPLAPSALGEDAEADPPFAAAGRVDAARRGVLMHKLLERLPLVAADQRLAAATAWLARNAAELDSTAHHEMAAQALDVVGHPEWQALFAPQALAEVPIAALVSDQMVVGTIDRLIVEPDLVRLIDFKTARRVPEGLDQVPAASLRQMAAYVAALEVTYPGRRVEAALLYTAAPRLIALPDEVLAPHKQALRAAQ